MSKIGSANPFLMSYCWITLHPIGSDWKRSDKNGQTKKTPSGVSKLIHSFYSKLHYYVTIIAWHVSIILDGGRIRGSRIDSFFLDWRHREIFHSCSCQFEEVWTMGNRDWVHRRYWKGNCRRICQKGLKFDLNKQKQANFGNCFIWNWYFHSFFSGNLCFFYIQFPIWTKENQYKVQTKIVTLDFSNSNDERVFAPVSQAISGLDIGILGTKAFSPQNRNWLCL